MPINIPRIRTARIDVTPKEIKVGESIALLKMPAQLLGATESAFLRAICATADDGGGKVADPRRWTVQERAFVVCRYLSAVSAKANFDVYEGASLSDFISMGEDYVHDTVQVESDAGQPFDVLPLLGVHHEVLERLCRVAGEWAIGMMACQVFPAGEARPDLADMSEREAVDWVSSRIDALKDMPESDVEDMLSAFWAGTTELAHFFALTYDDAGPCFARKTGDGTSAPTRFPADSCLSEAARRLAGRTD
ncbi:MAG: hypothetical protein RLZZ373_3203 [Pseudomonadota bacterium]|jgi:hypothetical protein